MRQLLKDYGRVIRLPRARRVFLADVSSKFGDWFSFVAANVLLFTTGGPFAIAIFNVARAAIPALLTPFAGKIGARFAPNRVMIAADAARAAGFGIVAVLAGAGAHWSVVMVVLLLANVAGTAHSPAERRLHRQLVEPGELASLNALVGAVGTVAIMIAPAIGGAVIAIVGGSVLFVINALTFVISGLLLLGVRSKVETDVEEAASSGASWTNVLGGLIRDRRIASSLAIQVGGCFTAGATLVLVVPIAEDTIGQDGAVGFLTSVIGVFSFLGMLVGGAFARRPRWRWAALSVVVCAVTMGFLGASERIGWIVICLALLGLFANIPDPLYWTAYQNIIPPERMGASFGVIDAVLTTTLIGSAAIAGLLLTAFGVFVAGLVCAGVVSVFAVAGFVLAPAAVRWSEMAGEQTA